MVFWPIQISTYRIRLGSRTLQPLKTLLLRLKSQSSPNGCLRIPTEHYSGLWSVSIGSWWSLPFSGLFLAFLIFWGLVEAHLRDYCCLLFEMLHIDGLVILWPRSLNYLLHPTWLCTNWPWSRRERNVHTLNISDGVFKIVIVVWARSWHLNFCCAPIIPNSASWCISFGRVLPHRGHQLMRIVDIWAWSDCRIYAEKQSLLRANSSSWLLSQKLDAFSIILSGSNIHGFILLFEFHSNRLVSSTNWSPSWVDCWSWTYILRDFGGKEAVHFAFSLHYEFGSCRKSRLNVIWAWTRSYRRDLSSRCLFVRLYGRIHLSSHSGVTSGFGGRSRDDLSSSVLTRDQCRVITLFSILKRGFNRLVLRIVDSMCHVGCSWSHSKSSASISWPSFVNFCVVYGAIKLLVTVNYVIWWLMIYEVLNLHNFFDILLVCGHIGNL